MADRQVLFIQGGGAGTYDEWDDKLVASLRLGLGRGYDVLYPRMPDEADPSFAAWTNALEREIAQLDLAVVVGHSVGGTILIHTVAQHPRLLKHISAICLIAPPYVGEGGWPSDDVSVGPDWATPLTGTAVYLYQGDEDETTPVAHAGLYAKAMPQAHLRYLSGRDHQLNNELAEVAYDIRRLGE